MGYHNTDGLAQDALELLQTYTKQLNYDHSNTTQCNRVYSGTFEENITHSDNFEQHIINTYHFYELTKVLNVDTVLIEMCW